MHYFYTWHISMSYFYFYYICLVGYGRFYWWLQWIAPSGNCSHVYTGDLLYLYMFFIILSLYYVEPSLRHGRLIMVLTPTRDLHYTFKGSGLTIVYIMVCKYLPLSVGILGFVQSMVPLYGDILLSIKSEGFKITL